MGSAPASRALSGESGEWKLEIRKVKIEIGNRKSGNEKKLKLSVEVFKNRELKTNK
jgi:hypothetical protein